jgi:hydroxymethylglutaryl-CoA lyase
MSLPKRVTIVEVGPRDGFQMETAILPTDVKVGVIELLAQAGVPKIEATSFVSPKLIPQLADAADVMALVKRRPGTRYTVLVPNAKGAERAVAARADGIRLVICASETYNQRNVGMSVAESLALLPRILEVARPSGTPVEAVIGLAFGCPFEGEVPEARVIALAREIAGHGVLDISLADSIGTANPVQVRRVADRALRELPQARFSLHIHDTRGLGLANVLAALECGIDCFDAGFGGLGGCPVFAGASGNIPTEDLVNMCEEMGIETGIDLGPLREAARRVQELLGRTLPSHVLRVGTRAELYARAAARQRQEVQGGK